MLRSILLVGAGSFLGGVLRYLVSVVMKGVCGQGFPWGTLAVNIVGCLAFGVIFALFGKYEATATPWCLLLTTGLCGGFTTFSTFAYESMQMLQNGNIGGFVGYVATSVVVGLFAVALGYWLVK